ncbi:MAG: hypothetical protein Q9P90_18660, partial [candidate division KSB1 bacterium]|nr:hypothetical protein [candidate division KSB1 bacterium]
ESAAPEDPAIAALPEQARQMVKMMIGRIQQVNDPNQLQMMISQMASRMGQVQNDDQRKAMEVVLQKARQRLQELQQKK